MSETQAVAPEVVETQYEGRYIPYGGGCLGWHENSGVLKVELPNNYKFFTAIDADLVRARQFEREGKKTNKRRGDRKDLTPDLPITLKWGKDSKEAMAKDLSIHGMRVQFVNDEVALKKDDKVTVQFNDKAGRNVLLEVVCTVMWVEKAGRIRTIWNFGVGFPTLTEEQEAIVKQVGNLGDDK